jgi:hypothetical protein
MACKMAAYGFGLCEERELAAQKPNIDSIAPMFSVSQIEFRQPFFCKTLVVCSFLSRK